MKGKDLMIGDIIKTNITSWKEDLKDKCCRVDYLANNYIASVLIDDPERRPYGESSSFEPISLTKEIIEKNGFKFVPVDELDGAEQALAALRKSDGRYVYKRRGGGNLMECVNIFYNGRHKNWVIEQTFGKEAVIDVAPVNFIHQLQHVLRLCGIDKEIIL